MEKNEIAEKKEIEAYYERRALTYEELDYARTIVACVRSIGIEDHIRIIKPEKNAKVLDIGCGNGRFLTAFSKLSNNVFGFDLSREMLEKAKKKHKNLIRGDAEMLPFRSESFDIVHAAGLLGVYKSEKILEECFRVAKFNGRVFISFPALESFSGIFFKIFEKLPLNYNPTLLDYWYSNNEIVRMVKNIEEKSRIRIKFRIHKLGFEPPFQRVFKNFESEKLVKAFIFFEKKLRDKPFFRYFKARYLLEARKLDKAEN